MSPFILLSLIGGVLGVDERAGWQSLFGQPVFAALIVGAVTGGLQEAMIVGVTLELVWFSILPMRGLSRPDPVSGGLAGCGTAALLAHFTADPRTGLIAAAGVIVGLLAGEIGGRLSALLFGLQNKYLSDTEFPDSLARRDIARRLLSLQLGSIVYIFVIEAVLVWALLWSGYHAAEVVTRHVDGGPAAGIELWGVLLPAMGAAALIQMFWHRHLKRVLILSAVLALLVLWLN
jgi:mannose/fructose/N-acetylgalactosamine-specific phosphotransferase system component IIC